MLNVSVADAKTRLSELIDQLNQEEEIVITRHGQPVARLVPVPRPKLAEHSISAPIPLAHGDASGGLELSNSGRMPLR